MLPDQPSESSSDSSALDGGVELVLGVSVVLVGASDDGVSVDVVDVDAGRPVVDGGVIPDVVTGATVVGDGLVEGAEGAGGKLVDVTTVDSSASSPIEVLVSPTSPVTGVVSAPSRTVVLEATAVTVVVDAGVQSAGARTC